MNRRKSAIIIAILVLVSLASIAIYQSVSHFKSAQNSVILTTNPEMQTETRVETSIKKAIETTIETSTIIKKAELDAGNTSVKKHLRFYDTLHTSNRKSYILNDSMSESKRTNIKIYRFNDEGQFHKERSAQVENRNLCLGSTLKPQGLEPIYDEYQYSISIERYGCFELPPLAQGYYMVQFEDDRVSMTQLIQVSPYQVYTEYSSNHHLLWCLDSRSGLPQKDMSVFHDGIFIGKTQEDGTFVTNTEAYTLTLETPEMNLYIPGGIRSYDEISEYDYTTGTSNSFININKPMYRKNDTVTVFGAVYSGYHHLNNTIEVVMSSGGKVLESKSVALSEYGTYFTSFTLKDIPNANVYITASNNQIGLGYIDIPFEDYYDPSTKAKLKIDKQIIGPGEQIYAKVIANNLEFFFSDWENQVFKTEDTGVVNLVLKPEFVFLTSKPYFQRLSLMKANEENGMPLVTSTVQVFPTPLILSGEIKKDDKEGKLTISIKTHQLRLPSGFVDKSNMDSYRGKGLNQNVVVSVKELGGTSETIIDKTVMTKNGEITLNCDYKYDRNYKIELKSEDAQGKTVYFEEFISSQTYKVDQPIRIVGSPLFEMSKKNPSMAKTLFIAYKDKYIHHRVSNDHIYETVLSMDILPNILLKEVYYNGDSFGGTQDNSFKINSLGMSENEKHLNIKLITDKSVYKSGEEVVLSVNTSYKGRPVQAQVFVQVVNEAYYVNNELPDSFEFFYAPSDYTGVKSLYNTDMLNDEIWPMFGKTPMDEPYALSKEVIDWDGFISIETDDNGNGAIKFKLPQGEADWRITAHGVDKKFCIGTSSIFCKSTLTK